MKIIFLGGIFDSKNKPTIVENSIGGIQNAADTLQKSIIKGLITYFSDVLIVNMPFLGSYPRYYKKVFFLGNESEIFKVKVSNVSFCNLRGYKMFSRLIHLIPAIWKFENSIFILYSINMPFLLAAFVKKKLGRNNKLVLVVPDLPEFMDTNNSLIKRVLLNIQDFLLKNIFFKSVDAFVLLTEGMNEKLNQPESKVVVVEGIFSNETSVPSEDAYVEVNKNFVVLYAGTLDERYGIIDLISQFSKIQVPDVELVICGAGNEYSTSKILNAQNSDSRIRFLGQLPREEVLALQKKASLLINPRKPEEFTKFSFPSKVMEYFASGTPVLMYRLEGIPSEYYQYCYTLDIDNSNSIHDEILLIKNTSKEKRNEVGQNAKTFILTQKNEIMQVGKIYSLIKALFNEG